MNLKEIIHNFNRGDFRRKQIPMELASVWPSVKLYNGKIAVTIPYFRRRNLENGIALYPIYCAVTILADNPDRILDFTLYPMATEWNGIDFSKPVGKFKHKALEDVKTKSEYNALCDRLYAYYDEMIESVKKRIAFENEDSMKALFSKLMEPSLYPFYLKINKRFYVNFCNL